ncbi:flagellar assembly protein FliH [Rhodoferax sp. U2-2l]|uniref:FliH/SctL family protein n=1 Tax=Rhodoferax sp. U2-2l TaxID=2884000 RepID=UPI001D0A12AA|nr:flagellar assembly protein FliH [Rhodoferax sp. U2-2l]MCB8748223.1 flagellar assembly protein FliH [Rhodoferax sp. U2-2l]
MRNYARFIPGEEIDAVEQWEFGSINTAAQLQAAQAKAREAQEEVAHAEVDRQEAFKEGFAAGLAQGKLQAQAELQRQQQAFMETQVQDAARQFAALFESAQRAQLDAEQAMAQGVLDLSCEVARQVVRHELASNPQVLMPVLTEAIALLGAEFKTAVVKLHPTDLAALGPQIQAKFADLHVSLRAEPAVMPGGCLVESAGMVVDGSLPRRWQRAVATLGLSDPWEVPGDPA